MESKAAVGSATSDGSTTRPEVPQNRRKRRLGIDDAKPRYFLPKPGSSIKNPELGQELAAEGDALVRSFQSNQHFFVLTVWKAVAEQNGSNPVITKQAVADSTAE
jgi:hypothetical protein